MSIQNEPHAGTALMIRRPETGLARRIATVLPVTALFARYIIRALLCMAAVPSISDPPVHAQERVYVSTTDIAQPQIGERLVPGRP